MTGCHAETNLYAGVQNFPSAVLAKVNHFGSLSQLAYLMQVEGKLTTPATFAKLHQVYFRFPCTVINAN